MGVTSPPLVEIKFFDGSYDYALPESRSQWEKVRTQLLSKSKPLARLYKLAVDHLVEILAQDRRIPECSFKDLPKELKDAFVKAFSSPVVVGENTRDFWLSVSELDQGSLGALYEALNQEWTPAN